MDRRSDVTDKIRATAAQAQLRHVCARDKCIGQGENAVRG